MNFKIPILSVALALSLLILSYAYNIAVFGKPTIVMSKVCEQPAGVQLLVETEDGVHSFNMGGGAEPQKFCFKDQWCFMARWLVPK